MQVTRRIALTAAVALFAGSTATAQEFIPIEPLPGHSSTRVHGVSSDGSVVVGTSGSGASSRAFYWTADTGVVELPNLGGTTRAEGVSGDGSVVVGFSGGQGVRWVNGEIEVLEVTPEIYFVYPVSASADGNAITGEGEADGELIAFLWTPDDLINLGGINWDYEVIGTAISYDGNVVVGLSEGWDGSQGFRWTKDEGMIGLGWLPGFGGFSTATALSADGSVIGGQADIGGGGYASAYWVEGPESAGWNEIPSVIDSAFIANAVTGVSGDGSLMVGYNTGTNPAARTVFLYDEINGARRLQQALEQEYGIDLMGWQLADHPSPYNNQGSVNGISTDGNAIIGNTIHPDTFDNWGWVAYLTSAPDIPGDINGDGCVDHADLALLLAAYGSAPGDPNWNPAADINGDGTVGHGDLALLLSNYGEGC